MMKNVKINVLAITFIYIFSILSLTANAEDTNKHNLTNNIYLLKSATLENSTVASTQTDETVNTNTVKYDNPSIAIYIIFAISAILMLLGLIIIAIIRKRK